MTDSAGFAFCAFVLLSSFSAAQTEPPSLRVEASGAGFDILSVRDGRETLLHHSPSPVQEPALRQVPGSAALAATWSQRDDRGDATPWYALSLDGERFHPAQETSYEIHLRYARFDPLRGVPAVPSALDGEGASGRLHIVQYWTQGLEDYRDAIRALGGEVHLFLAQHANVVEIPGAAIERLRSLPFVRWVGPFHPAYKLEEELLAEQAAGADFRDARKVNLLTTRRGEAGGSPVRARILMMGGRVDSVSEHTHLMTATLTPGQIAELARMDEVQWIDRWSAPEHDMNIARAVHGADYVQSVGGYTGSGVRVEVMDGGCDTLHGDLQNNMLHTINVVGDHGTCTSGIVCGSGAGNASAKGAMPAAFLVVGYYNNFAGGSRYAHTAELQNPSLAYQCVLQSNSWGGGLTTAYTSVSQNMDLILFDLERISIFQSQSNAGSQSSRPEAWAKNVVSIGGIRHFDSASTSDDSWSGGASVGPAADGRIKPDLASFYDNVLCPDSTGLLGYTISNYYSSFGGTSAATPIVAGHAGLLIQMWADGIFGNPTPGATVFENRPNNTTLKALLVNTASQWTFSGVAHDLTRTHQGWGRPDLRTAHDLCGTMYIVDETDVLSNLESTTHALLVEPERPAFKATLVYRDNPGTTSSTVHRVNDLDLQVTAPDGTSYWGNAGLKEGNWSTPGGSPNGRDTVENVFVQSPAPGTWRVQVIARELNQDTHVETPGLDADYALVVTGVTPVHRRSPIRR